MLEYISHTNTHDSLRERMLSCRIRPQSLYYTPMYLFLDTLSPESYIALFDADRRIQASMQQPMKHKEFEQLPEVIEAILQKKGLGYADI